MIEVEGSRSFDVTSDVLWAVVADPARLANWVPTMWRAEPAGTEEVHLEGESHGHRYSLDSQLRIDQDHRSLHWGAEGDQGYRGWLQLAGLPSGSEVRIHISVPGDGLTSPAEAAVAEIQQGLEETFDRLAGLIRTLPASRNGLGPYRLATGPAAQRPEIAGRPQHAVQRATSRNWACVEHARV
jgi:uncharacterized protein YndB with AHSA1/START domain